MPFFVTGYGNGDDFFIVGIQRQMPSIMQCTVDCKITDVRCFSTNQLVDISLDVLSNISLVFDHNNKIFNYTTILWKTDFSSS